MLPFAKLKFGQMYSLRSLFRRGKKITPSRGDLPLQKSVCVEVFEIGDEGLGSRLPLLNERVRDAEVHSVVHDVVILVGRHAPVQFFVLPAVQGGDPRQRCLWPLSGTRRASAPAGSREHTVLPGTPVRSSRVLPQRSVAQ